MFNKPVNTLPSPEEQQANVISGLSRTQSLRAQAKHADNSVLGRSSSLKSTGEVCDSHLPRISADKVAPPSPDPVCIIYHLAADQSQHSSTSLYSPDTTPGFLHGRSTFFPSALA